MTLIPRQRLQPKSANFMRKGKWRLTDGDKVRWYKVNDETFLREVGEGVRLFGAKDVLICEVLMRQSVGETGELRMEYEIASVLDHIHAPTQARLLAGEHIVLRDAGAENDAPGP